MERGADPEEGAEYRRSAHASTWSNMIS